MEVQWCAGPQHAARYWCRCEESATVAAADKHISTGEPSVAPPYEASCLKGSCYLHCRTCKTQTTQCVQTCRKSHAFHANQRAVKAQRRILHQAGYRQQQNPAYDQLLTVLLTAESVIAADNLLQQLLGKHHRVPTYHAARAGYRSSDQPVRGLAGSHQCLVRSYGMGSPGVAKLERTMASRLGTLRRQQHGDDGPKTDLGHTNITTGA